MLLNISSRINGTDKSDKYYSYPEKIGFCKISIEVDMLCSEQITSIRLECAVERYEAAIAALEAAAEKLSAEHILEVLVARDAVQAAIIDKTQANPGSLIKKVNELDVRLRKQAQSINQAVTLADLRSIFNPPEKDWWWLLDPPKPLPWRDRYDWLWRGLSISFLTASLSLVVDISTRFLSGGPDTLGAFAVIIQSVLTLLAGGGALTKTGREGTEQILKSLKVPKSLWDEINCSFSFLLLLIMLGFRFSLPLIAEGYKELGDRAYYCERQLPDAEEGKEGEKCNRQLASAENHYSRAIKLDPDNTEAHYQLGKIHAELQEFDEATLQYKIALKGGILKAYDDLAHLSLEKKDKDYTNASYWLSKCLLEVQRDQKQPCTTLEELAQMYLQEKKYAEAERWLLVGVTDGTDASKVPFVGLTPEQYKKRQYKMFTYLGQALLGQARYREAEVQLRTAINLVHEKAPAHCLLAQVLEKQNDQPHALEEWEHCLSYGTLIDPDEGVWISKARQRLAAKGEP